MMDNTTRRKIIYADDDPDDRRLLKDILLPYKGQLELITFSGGEQLLHYLQDGKESKPCLILLDLFMPAMDGRETLRRLRALPGYEQVTVVLFTTSTMPADAAFARKWGVELITKPLHERQFHELVSAVLRCCDIRKSCDQTSCS